MYQWRKFQFFEERTGPVNLPLDLTLDHFSCSTSGTRGQLLFGSQDGTVYRMERSNSQQLSVTQSFTAHVGRVLAMQFIKRRNMLITLGEEENSTERLSSTTVKLWSMEMASTDAEIVSSGTTGSSSGRTDAPNCIRILKAFPPKFPESAIITFSVREETPTSLLMAIGLESGYVYLIRGDVSKDRVARMKLAVEPQTEEKQASTVTGLGFRDDGSSTHLFAVTFDSVNVFSFSQQQQAPVKQVLDSHGCEVGCSAISDSQDLMIGRPEAVYVYHTDGRGPCYIFEGKKTNVHFFRGHLLVVSCDPKVPDGRILTIYDLQNKLIVFTASVGPVAHILNDRGSIVVFFQDSKLMVLGEKSMAGKLELLFKKNLFTVAVNLVQSQKSDQTAVADVLRKYGDHLYRKQDYDEAMKQYLHTIGHLEPSYVIQKYLDSQRIHNLTLYLEKLHEKELASADHTTLLLNCYTKLKDVEKLDAFVAGSSGRKVSFDVETAIRVCREAGYFGHALLLAEHTGLHEWYLKVQIEDQEDFDDALRHLSALPLTEIEALTKRYGSKLVAHRPSETTDLLLKICCKPAAEATGSVTPVASAASPIQFVHMYVDHSNWLVTFLESFLNKDPESRWKSSIHDTLLELYLSEGKSQKGDSIQNLEKAETLIRSQWPEYEAEPNYDAHLALVLCRMHNFTSGIRYLYERMRMYREVMASYMKEKDYKGLISCCKRLGNSGHGGDTTLWLDLVNFMGEKGENCEAEVKEMLDYLVMVEEDQEILSPILALQSLAKNPCIKLGVVKEYLTQKLNKQSLVIEEDRAAISKYQDETESMKVELLELKTKAKIFQLSKCSSCMYALDLPAVHFLCMHSFHLRCLGENESECPICAPAHKTVLEMTQSLIDNANDHDTFFQMLQSADDGFSVIANYFGRGMLNKGNLQASPKPPPLMNVLHSRTDEDL